MPSSLILNIPQKRYRPADQITGTITAAKSVSYRSLEAFLVLVERSRDFTHNNVYDSSGQLTVKSVVDNEGKLNPSDTVSFKLSVPKLPWPAYSTEYGSLSWEVQVKCDRLGKDLVLVEAIEISV